jgi:hypothetical protein
MSQKLQAGAGQEVIRLAIMEAEMGTLYFVCPETGREVSSQLELEADSLHVITNGLYTIPCPNCREAHDLAKLHTWLDGDEGYDDEENFAPTRRT